MLQGNWYSGNANDSPPDGNVSIRYIDDTIVNGTTYSKFCRHELWTNTWCIAKGYSFFTRYDNGKIFIKAELDASPEVLAYNFTLNIGDTFTLKNLWFAPTVMVISKDSIVTTDNIKRIRMRLNSTRDTADAFTWIEGIGDERGGFLNESDPEEGRTRLVCHNTVNGRVFQGIYPIDMCTTLLLTNDVIEPSATSNSIKISENPFSELLRFEVANAKGKIQLADLTGRVIYADVLIQKDNNIPTHHLSPGIYYLQVLDDNNNLTKKKLLKL